MNSFNLFAIGFVLSCLVVSSYAQCGCNQRGVMANSRKVDDEILSKENIMQIQGYKAADGEKWPNNQLNYKFGPSFPKEDIPKVRDFLAVYQKELGNCIKFVENGGPVSAEVGPGNGCSANVGYNTHFQLSVNLHPACVNKRNVKHEFSHLLGFMHEHSRPDRDNYLKITYENVKTPLCGNFYLCKGCKITTTYDYDSIMQYPSNSFTCNGKDTILKNNGGQIPFNMEVTKNDIKRVRDYYGC